MVSSFSTSFLYFTFRPSGYGYFLCGSFCFHVLVVRLLVSVLSIRRTFSKFYLPKIDVFACCSSRGFEQRWFCLLYTSPSPRD